ncbi:extensin [Burkholderia sp. IMCC1007]|uniref:extensin n=1 Tax=Burkholderia sp. IMCC1007 TaxID=3004104 RepID=UPI0022B2C136|nr:extensin [Burkholderia sp. IMCC1007]
MTRTRKNLMIAGGLLVAAAGTGYVMLLRADHRAIAEAGIGDSAAPAAAVAAANDGHTAEGSIAPPAAVAVPSAHVDDSVPQQVPAARAGSAPASAAVVPVIAAQAAPAKPSAPPPTVHVVTVEPDGATPPKVAPAQPVQPVQSAPPVQAAQASRPSQPAYQPTQHAMRKRDGLERHAAATTNRNTETPETAQLVRESAKLDPSLPPPQYVPPSVPPSNPERQHASAGPNAVGAAMTEQLVRQSSSFKAPAAAPAPAPANAGPVVAQ